MDTTQETTPKQRLIYTSKESGRMLTLAVNPSGVECKATDSGIYTGTEANYWTPRPELNYINPIAITAYGALPNNSFVAASYKLNSKTYIHNADGTSGTEIVFTSLPSNRRTLCISNYTCFADIAFDGNGHTWMVGRSGHLCISTESQFTTKGGPVKHAGYVQDFYEFQLSGVAFDNLGQVYYGFQSTEQTASRIAVANMTKPLETTLFIEKEGIVLNDLASYAFPKMTMTELLK